MSFIIRRMAEDRVATMGSMGLRKLLSIYSGLLRPDSMVSFQPVLLLTRLCSRLIHRAVTFLFLFAVIALMTACALSRDTIGKIGSRLTNGSCRLRCAAVC